MHQEHPFAQYVRILGRGKRSGRPFTEDEAYQAMTMILKGEVEDIQLGAFLLLIRVREETTEELTGFTRAARDYIRPGLSAVLKSKAAIDWPSYAGKHKQLNWYILAAQALADSGISVFMHGTNEHTPGRLYSHTVLSELGIKSCCNADEAAAELKSNNFAYLPLEVFCPPLERMIMLRHTLGVRSPIHTLVRLLNPSDATSTLVSIFHPAYRPIHQETALKLGYHNLAVFKGEGGEVERKPDARCLVQMTRGHKFKQDEEWPPTLTARATQEECFEISQLKTVWRSRTQSQYGEAAIIGTLAIALHNLGKSDSKASAYELAGDIWLQRNKQRI